MSTTREEKEAAIGRIFTYIVLGIGLMFFGLAALDSIFSVDVDAKISKIEAKRISGDMNYKANKYALQMAEEEEEEKRMREMVGLDDDDHEEV